MIKVYDLNMQPINLNGIQCLSFAPDSPVPNHNLETIENREGTHLVGTKLDGRSIKATFLIEAVDNLDFQLLKNEAYRIFNPKKELYIIDNRQPGKRWRVVTASSFTINPVSVRMGNFEIQFLSPSPFAESIGTTLDPLTFDSELWQTGQGLTLDETMYTHSTNTFQIYNASDGEVIDPTYLPLLITFKGPSTNLQIKNLTTGDTWAYTGTTIASDTIELNGVRTLKNGVSAFGNTNHKVIKLAPSYNDFELIGTTGSFTISFAFRFYTI